MESVARSPFVRPLNGFFDQNLYQDLPTGHHLRLLSLQKPPEETSWKVLVYVNHLKSMVGQQSYRVWFTFTFPDVSPARESDPTDTGCQMSADGEEAGSEGSQPDPHGGAIGMFPRAPSAS